MWSSAARASAGVPSGYQKLVTDFDAVHAQMVRDLSGGKDVWKSWLAPGVARGDSLYVWLEAERLARTGDANGAYRMGMLGSALVEMDLSVCGMGSERRDELRQAWIQKNAGVFAKSASSQVKREALVAAVVRAGRIIDGGGSSGMFCLYEKVRMGRDGVVSIDGVRDIPGKQRRALEDFKFRYHYQKAWELSDISDVWPD